MMNGQVSRNVDTEIFVDENRPGSLAILFADISQSTKIFENIGDRNAQNIINTVLSDLSKAVINNKGKVIKTIGDEILCSFQNPDDAVETAIELHKICDINSVKDMDISQINIQIGISYGSVIIKTEDVFGETVIMAKRMVDIAKQREIIVSRNLINAIRPPLRALSKHIEKTQIKGKKGEYDIYEIIWEISKQTMINYPASTIGDDRKNHSRLKLEYQGRLFTLGKDCQKIIIGREPHNDLIINNHRISRLHAIIEFRKGKFFIKDHSSNGTYIVFDKTENIFLKRNEAELCFSGMIFPGLNKKTNIPESIKFTIEEIFSNETGRMIKKDSKWGLAKIWNVIKSRAN